MCLLNTIVLLCLCVAALVAVLRHFGATLHPVRVWHRRTEARRELVHEGDFVRGVDNATGETMLTADPRMAREWVEKVEQG